MKWVGWIRRNDRENWPQVCAGNPHKLPRLKKERDATRRHT